MKKTKPRIKLIIGQNYLTMINDSVGSRMFRHLFAMKDGLRSDLTENGRLSCALYASSILLMLGLIKERHATVEGTIKDLKKSGWKRTRKLRPGAVLVWEPALHGSRMHRHIGFYLGHGKAVSNSTNMRAPIRHHWTFGARNKQPRRKVEAVYWNRKLG